jgi:molecular chaperone DnaK
MVADAASHADEDAAAKELAEARNNGENLAYQVEKQIKDLDDKIDDSTKEQLTDAVKEVREALNGTETAEIVAKTEALGEVMNAASEELYKAAAAEQEAAASENGASANGDSADEAEEEVVDAEVVDEGK